MFILTLSLCALLGFLAYVNLTDSNVTFHQVAQGTLAGLSGFVGFIVATIIYLFF